MKISALLSIALAVTVLVTVVADLNVANAQAIDYDSDDDGLIEISSLEQLNVIRWDLNGDGWAEADADSYDLAFPNAATQMGCPGNRCNGYELTRDLDFKDSSSYASGAINDDWANGDGWVAIGSFANPFRSTLEGNKYTISNLLITRSYGGNEQYYGSSGLFVESTGVIRQIGLLDVQVTGEHNVGALTGVNSGVIASSYVTGMVSGNSTVGALSGANGGKIIHSYATADVSGSSWLGGLVGGSGTAGNIISSYATGNVTIKGATERNYCAGGLVGGNSGRITSSFATGTVSGNNVMGGLVGWNDEGSIISSYAVGNVSGNEGIGGLVGWVGAHGLKGSIVASYSVGKVSGIAEVGGLLGHLGDSSVVNSYWDVETSGQSAGVGDVFAQGAVGKTTAELQSPTDYTGIYAPWRADLDNIDRDNDPTTCIDDYWDFGTSTQYPALKADVDGDGTPTWEEFGNQRAPVPLPTIGFTAISSGANHVCAIHADGSINCWGDNSSGQASPPATGSYTSISGGDSHTCAIRADHAVGCWGSLSFVFP